MDAGLPVGITVAREGAGATAFEGSADAAAGAGAAITPAERDGIDAVGSATGGRVDMLVFLYQEIVSDSVSLLSFLADLEYDRNEERRI